MKFVWFLFNYLVASSSLIFGTKKLNIIDKSHVKTYLNNWIHIWKVYPNPLSDTRINESWKTMKKIISYY